VIEYLSEIPLPGRAFAQSHAPDHTTPSPIGFVAGSENRLVASVIHRLMRLEPNGRPSHLLALFGPSGAGKTHLTQGLVRYLNDTRGAETATYLPASDFYRQYLVAVKQNAVSDFRRAVRAHELLAIDDLQQLPANDRVSQELRYTLDAYEESGGTVVVASRRAPIMLANIAADVRSRLAAALMVQLAPPGPATRVRIIRRASESLGHPISEEAATRLARSSSGNANDLFGAVFEYGTVMSGRGNAPSPGAEPLLISRPRHQATIREILAVVARYYQLPQAQIKSSSRRRSVVAARAMAVYLARELAGATYDQIGRALGGRDHTTIMHNYRKIDRDRTREPAVEEAIDELRRRLVGR
jgi:chromosomal replication initiator protein